MNLTLQNAQTIVDGYLQDPAVVKSIERLAYSPTCAEYSVTVPIHRLTIVLFLTQESADAFTSLLDVISGKSSIPIPAILKPHHSHNAIDHTYIVLSHPDGASLHSSQPSLTPQSITSLDIRIGTYLRELHLIDNDWFGLPTNPSEWNSCYTWQECFIQLLEQSFDDAREAGISLPYDEQQLHGSLSRAIAFYLFDDVEVPSLVWNASLGWRADIKLSETETGEGERAIGALTGWSNALWGDGLMEGALYTPSESLLEGYGGSPIVFQRQHTKRLWYTLYSALQTLVRLKQKDVESETSGSQWDEDRLKEILVQTAETLKNAPCI